MLPIKKILNPIDLHAPSSEALQAAEELARHFSAELYLLHVITPIPAMSAFAGAASNLPARGEAMGFDIVSYQKELETSAQKTLARIREEKIAEDVNCTVAVAYGEPSQKIAGYAAEKEIELIVLATRGLTGVKRVLLGSVAEKVVRHAPCSVMTIPLPEED